MPPCWPLEQYSCSGWKLWPTPMCILLPHFLLHPAQLWHLQLWTPCSDLSIGGMAPISPRNHTPHHHYHQPQKPLLYQRSSKTVQVTGQMVIVPTGLQLIVAGHPWNQNGPSGHVIQTLWRPMSPWPCRCISHIIPSSLLFPPPFADHPDQSTIKSMYPLIWKLQSTGWIT